MLVLGGALEVEGRPPPKSDGGHMTHDNELKFAIGGLDLLRACSPGRSPEAMLDGVCQVLHRFFKFDIVTFAEYASDPAASDTILVLGRYAVDEGKRFDWPARWLRMPKGAIQVHVDKVVVVSNMETSFANPALEELRSNPVIQTYLERGTRSLLAALYWEDGRLLASLTLARKGESLFDEQDKADLEALPVGDTLRAIRVAYQMSAAAFRQEVRDLFPEGGEPDQVAPIIVRRLCEHFRWDCVAVFHVAGIRERFELIAQYALDKRLLIAKNYSQSLNIGVLGRVARTGKAVRVEDTLGPSKQGYKQIAPEARSCLCCPVKVDGVVEWILDCESAEVGAFQYPDQVELTTIVTEAQKTMALWFEMRLNRALIENVDQGLIVVDRENRITRLNALAAQLLGAPIAQDDLDADQASPNIGTHPFLRGRLLTDFGADEHAKDDLKAGHIDTKQRHLLGTDGVIRNLAVSSREAEDAFNRRIWRLSDPKIWNWITALEYMRTTVQGVAQQTRGPLLLANALIAKASWLLSDNVELQGLLSKARACLAKTDITYERLVAGMEVQRDPIGSPVAVDVSAALERFLTNLPIEDRGAVSVTRAESIPAAWADPNRLDFILHSTIGYLLATRLPTCKIAVDLGGSADEVTVNIACAIQESDGGGLMPADSDPLANARAGAREAATHALGAVKNVIEMNRGGTWALDLARGTFALHFGLASPARALETETVPADG
jgi:PAS domain-containing protein